MSLPRNALRDRGRRFRDDDPTKPEWSRRRYWKDELPLNGPVTLLVSRYDDDTYWRGHAHWIVQVTWGHGWHCYHDARDSRSVVRVAQQDCVKDIRGRKASVVRVRRTP